ncbi:MAG: hypothetical protein A2694_01065 [Candidatus Blackburnbacteria bacterium RIFCSPHIGHO2_01_FULL_40_17]|nr:MAG: radical SAM family Fe-S protein [Microgenomates group bacterium GW2011_GWA2_39_19]OGY07350.1 MAG: hypothetical protein A2694_01065 [Candidatus Blackburnbacteria bacterium RIFCSPHIGHO2_01_FULL_40_17]
MKVLLINPGQYVPVKINYPLNAFQPLGIGYMANVLLKNGYKVNILDVLAEGNDQEEIVEEGKYRYVGLPQEEIKKRIKIIAPDIVGVTMPFTAQSKAGHEMARLVKEINPKIKVVVGGSYPTAYADTILQDKNIDFAVRGEGELTLLELVKEIEGKRNKFSKINKVCCSAIKGLVFKKDGKTIINLTRPPLANLDDYSVAWGLFPMDKYFEAAQNVRASRSISTYGKRWATIYTSRGCPFTCSFCAGYLVMSRMWRPRSVDNVISEMEYLIDKYKIQHFDVEDDNFTLKKDRAKEICDKIIDKGWKIEWSTPNGIRADTVDEELIKKMKQSGCVRTIVAPESGSQWVVDNLMHKRLNLNKVKQVVVWCTKYKLSVDAFFLIGMPGEKERHIEKTIKYAQELRRLGVNDCGFGVLMPHKGTEAHQTAVDNGWLKDSESDVLVKGLITGEPMIETPHLSIQDVKRLFKKARKVNPTIPYSQLRLAFLILTRSPKRFIKLSISYLIKQLGFSEGILGT